MILHKYVCTTVHIYIHKYIQTYVGTIHNNRLTLSEISPLTHYSCFKMGENSDRSTSMDILDTGMPKTPG